MKYFLDTNICIYLLNGSSNKLAKNVLSLSPNTIKIPAIVKAELLYGAEKSNRKKENIGKVERFLSSIEVLPFDEISAVAYSKIRAKLETFGNVIGPNDLLIASIVITNNGTLVTNNLKEFKRVPKLKTANWI